MSLQQAFLFFTFRTHFPALSPSLSSSLSFSLNEGFFDSAISLPFLVIILYRILWHQTKKHVPIYLNLLTFVSLPIKEEKTVLALISSTVFCVILLLSLFLFSLLPASQTLLPYFQIPKLSFRLPASQTLLPKPSFLLPASQTLFPSSCFPNPACLLPASQRQLPNFQFPKPSLLQLREIELLFLIDIFSHFFKYYTVYPLGFTRNFDNI